MMELYIIHTRMWPRKPEIKTIYLSFLEKKIKVIYLHPNDIGMFTFGLTEISVFITEEEYALLLLQVS